MPTPIKQFIEEFTAMGQQQRIAYIDACAAVIAAEAGKQSDTASRERISAAAPARDVAPVVLSQARGVLSRIACKADPKTGTVDRDDLTAAFERFKWTTERRMEAVALLHQAGMLLD